MDFVLTYLSKCDLPCVNLALFILWFDGMGTGFKNIFNKNLIASENISAIHIFLPVGIIMPFLFLLMQISCQLAFSILSPFLT